MNALLKLSHVDKTVNMIYIDIKILDNDKCKNVLGGNLNQYLANSNFLFAAQKNVVFRIPIIGGFTNDNENLTKIIELLKKYHPLKVELVKEHNLGKNKYISLGRKPLNLNRITDKEMRSIKSALCDVTKLHIEICKVKKLSTIYVQHLCIAIWVPFLLLNNLVTFALSSIPLFFIYGGILLLTKEPLISEITDPILAAIKKYQLTKNKNIMVSP